MRGREKRHRRLRRRHDEPRAHPLARDVRDDQADRAVGEVEDVVEVAGHEARREVARGDAVALARDLGRRQDALLHRARELDLLLRELGLLETLDRLREAVLQQAESVEDEAHHDAGHARDRKVRAQLRERDAEVHEAEPGRDAVRQKPARDASQEVDARVRDPRRKARLREPAAQQPREPRAEDVAEGADQRAVRRDAGSEAPPLGKRHEVDDPEAHDGRDQDPPNLLEDQGAGLLLHAGGIVPPAGDNARKTGGT